MIESERAFEIGLVDELVDIDHVTTRALAWLESLLALPSNAMHSTRAIARADLIEAIADPARLDLPRFLDEWYGEETQNVLRTLVARLRSKGG
jgi:enoyl-CoA hydratase/carnithine racemase